MRFAGSYHRPDKIFAAETIEPRGADYEMLPAHFRNSKFTFKFRLPIIVERSVIPVIRLPRHVALSAENIVSLTVVEIGVETSMMLVPTPFSLFHNSLALSHCVAFNPDDIGLIDNPDTDGIGQSRGIQVFVPARNIEL